LSGEMRCAYCILRFGADCVAPRIAAPGCSSANAIA
jgi:hypothetical protein